MGLEAYVGTILILILFPELLIANILEGRDDAILIEFPAYNVFRKSYDPIYTWAKIMLMQYPAVMSNNPNNYRTSTFICATRLLRHKMLNLDILLKKTRKSKYQKFDFAK